MVEKGRLPTPFVLAAGAAGLWLTAYALWLALEPWGDRGMELFANSAYHVPIAFAAVLSTWAWLRGTGPRVFWGILALSNLAWLGSELTWSVQELSSGDVPFPWWTDLGYLCSYLLLSAAVLAVFRPSIRKIPTVAILDGLVLAAALGLAWWWAVLRPLDLSLDLASVVALAYPLLGLGLLALLASTRLLPSRRSTLTLRLVAAGVLCSAVSDAIYTRAVVTDSYLSGAWIELGWQAEACLFAVAGVAALVRVDRRSDWLRLRRPSSRASAAVVAPGAGLLAVAAVLGITRRDWLLLAVTLPLAATVLARSLLLVRGAWPTSGAGPDGVYFADELQKRLFRASHHGEGFGVALLEVPGTEPAALDRAHATLGDLGTLSRLEDGRIAVLLPRLDDADAFAAAEELRASFGGTASAGVAVWEEGESGESLVERAEALLAAAVRLGGNHTRGPEADLLLAGSTRLDPDRHRQLLELVAIVDARYGVDPVHSRRVASLTEALAVKLELDPESIRRAALGGLLHAVGTLTISDAELRPGGPFGLLESDAVARHARRGAEIVRRLDGLADVAAVVDSHQERCVGTGPKGQREEEIPFEARIVAVANALVTLTTDRPGAQELSLTSALTELWRFTETRYDPAVVSALFRLVREDDHVLDDGARFAVLV
jgi:HD-GYP domain-containing protein (c-di-GMP phosphodiesterase class II)